MVRSFVDPILNFTFVSISPLFLSPSPFFHFDFHFHLCFLHLHKLCSPPLKLLFMRHLFPPKQDTDVCEPNYEFQYKVIIFVGPILNFTFVSLLTCFLHLCPPKKGLNFCGPNSEFHLCFTSTSVSSISQCLHLY